MWINKAEYENLKSIAKNNEHDANMFRRLTQSIKEKRTIIDRDFVLMSFDVWNECVNNFQSEEDKVKDIQAELEWYKVKYYEMKMNTEQ